MMSISDNHLIRAFGTKWAVTNISDKKYTLQNVAHSAYAWVTHWSREDDDLKGKSSAHRFYISQAGSADRYV